MDQVVGDDDKAPVRRRRMYELALKEGTKPRTPHRHLPALGVRLEAQGQGVGGLLMSEYARSPIRGADVWRALLDARTA